MSYKEKREQIDLLQNQIDAHGQLSGGMKMKINYKFRLDWNYYSNSMEGNTLTMDETRSVMVGNLTVGGKPFKDIAEMKGHDEIISEILKIGKSELRLSEARIRAIHKGIMHEEDEAKKKDIGIWKTEPNYIYNYKGERFDFVAPSEVAERMHNLLNKTNAAIDAIEHSKKDAPHPIDVALQFHLDYVIIHPFYDGNGRTARILTNLLLISFGFPPFWVKDKERGIYNQYIGDIQGYGGNSDLFFEFAADIILRSQQLVLDAIEGKEIEEENDFDKEIEILKRMQNPTNEKTKKSKEVMQKTLEEVYCPLILELNSTLLKLNPLFKTNSWTYFEEPQPPKYEMPIMPVFVTVNETIKHLHSVLENRDSSSHQFKAAYWLMNYNDQDDFSMEVSLKIYFDETNYRIKVFIGQPLAGGIVIQGLAKIIKAIDKNNETPFDEFKDYELCNAYYDEVISKEKILDFAKRISSESLSFIKEKANNKKK
jgi:Fic family protein